MTDPMDRPLLVVGQEGARPPPTWQPGRVLYFDIRFDPGVPVHEVLELEQVPGRRRYAVHPCWRPLAADYGQQLLNRFFASALIDWRPAAVLVHDLLGATLDMVRLADLFGCPVAMQAPADAPEGERARLWLESARVAASQIIDGRRAPEGKCCQSEAEAIAALAAREDLSGGVGSGQFDYALYEFALRDHGLLYRMQAPYVQHFSGCGAVLDLACGAGIFLEALRLAGIPAKGVERNGAAVRYARGLGHEVIEDDALEYLARSPAAFDGIYCSHFVEHLPVDALTTLISRLAGALRPGGVLLLVFPDPESIRSQLLGFWRDPEHVRFYHPDLVELMCRVAGLESEFNSQRSPGRRVVPFSPEPPASAMPDGALPVIHSGVSRWDRLLERMGLARRRQLDELRDEHARDRERLSRRLQALEQNIHTLWAVNQTWAWDDNAVLRLRKR